MNTVRAQYWKKAYIPYIALIAIIAYSVVNEDNLIMLLALFPALYLLWGTGVKCHNCHNKVQRAFGPIPLPWCPKSCFNCGKNLTKR